jgi:hypothetical protein
VSYKFFLPKKINKVGTFQDIRPLENNPLILALLKVAAMFLLAKKPDFMVLLGTGTLCANNNKLFMLISGPFSL